MKLFAFKKRPAQTLLFITEQRTLRLDVDKSGAPMGDMETLSISCSNATKLAACISTCANAGKPFGRSVWLLYAQLSTTFLTVPSMQVEGVDEAGLIQALQFEWEGLTGQSSADMQLAYRLLSKQDDMSNYWISQINQLLFDDVQKAVKAAGSQLAGLLHPAGLPLFLSDSAQSDWLRLECWAGQIVTLRASLEGVAVQAFSFENRHWRKQLEQWIAKQDNVQASETLQNLLVDNIELLPDTSAVLHLHEDALLIHWLSLWSSVLARKDAPAVPILITQSKINKDLLMMLGGGLGALLICGGHLGWHLYQTRYYTAQTAELKKIETQMTTLNTAMASDRDKIDKLNEKLSKLKGDANSLPLLIRGVQKRPAQLLAALAHGRPDNLLIEEISVDKDHVIIRGICLDATSANELASYLEKQLAALGWSVIAPTKKNMELFAKGGPWEFALTLLDNGLAGFAKS